MWYRFSNDKQKDSEFITKLINALGNLPQDAANAQEYVSAPTAFKDLYDIFTNYSGEIENLYKGTLYLLHAFEPPMRIELMTFALRERRSTD